MSFPSFNPCCKHAKNKQNLPQASVSHDLPANSAPIPIVNDASVPFNAIATNASKIFKLQPNGDLLLKKKGAYLMQLQSNVQNANTSISPTFFQFGIYATINGEFLESSSIFRSVSTNQTSPLVNSVTFNAEKGDLINMAITTSGPFQVPAGPANEGFPSNSPITQNTWAANFYEIIYLGEKST